MNASLLTALRVVARADADPTRTVLFDRLAARSRAVRLARWTTHGPLRGRRLAALGVAAYGLFAGRVCASAPSAPIWMLPLFENDRRQIEKIVACIGPGWAERSGSGLRLLRALPRLLAGALRGGAARRYVRAVARLCRRYDFLVSCRTASALAGAMAATHALRQSSVRAVLVSSDYNAEAVGLAHAARRAGIGTIYVAHAPTHHLSPPLDFTLAILDGEAALERYRRKGPIRARPVFKGVDGREQPLEAAALSRPHPVIGIFLPKEVEWPVLRAIVQDVRRALAPRRVLIRWHPNATERPALEGVLADATDVAACPPGATLDEDARRCDWVIADRNSSVPLSTLKAGVPAVVVGGLAVFPGEQTDLYGLVADGIVPPPSCPSSLALEPQALVAFYGSGWGDRFRRHDASYGRPAHEVERDIRQAVLALVEGAKVT